MTYEDAQRLHAAGIGFVVFRISCTPSHEEHGVFYWRGQAIGGRVVVISYGRCPVRPWLVRHSTWLRCNAHTVEGDGESLALAVMRCAEAEERLTTSAIGEVA